MTERIKILFECSDRFGDGSFEIESLWARPREDGYALDNIPFHAMEVAWGDVVSTRLDADGMHWFDKLVRPSGHSTVRLAFADKKDVQRIREQLAKLGLSSEQSELPRLVAVDIPPQVPYVKIKEFLDEGESAGIFEYEEACLGQEGAE